ncbi:NAD(P)-dependent oxidoreductase [Curtobacterium sp. 22159]|uniref:NAD(P)-dependent oxidoreductase n=1 Tax=Curtobacterium sp. 22159 TaxID=3453882 RepID=UPI003F86CB58
MSTEPAPDGMVRPRIGIVGVGRMGSAVLRRLLGTGWTVAAHDLDPGRDSEVTRAGGRWCGDLVELVRWADVVLTVLPDGDVVRDALTGEVLAAAGPGTVWVDLTSGAPDTTRALAERAAAQGVLLLSAPIGGSPDDALHGRLQFFAGGPPEALVAARPVLETLARPGGIRVVGEDAPATQTVKLLVNALWFASAVATGEALLVAQAAGIEPGRMQELLSGTAGASAFSDDHFGRYLGGDDLETFGIDGVVTELRNLRAAAGDLRTPVLDTSLRQHEDALAHFGPALGELLGVRLLEEQNERSLRGC